jgi:hypothetical protein
LNRGSGTDRANGGWLRRLVKGQFSHNYMCQSLDKIRCTTQARSDALATKPNIGNIKYRSQRIKAINAKIIPPVKISGISNKAKNTKLSDSKMQMPATNGAANENMPTVGASLSLAGGFVMQNGAMPPNSCSTIAGSYIETDVSVNPKVVNRLKSTTLSLIQRCEEK